MSPSSKLPPRPGSPVRGSQTGMPIMALLDMLGRRGALRLIWELREGALTFRALQEAADLNPSTLNARLKELRSARVVILGDQGYSLTPEGTDLLAMLLPLRLWAEQWAKEADQT